MTTQDIAHRLVALSREGKFEQIYSELYDANAKSIEPDNDFGLGTVEGLHNFAAKGAAFNAQFSEFHSFYLSEPVVAGDYFSLAMGYDATHKTAGRVQLDEIALYQVKNGKVVSEQFFY